MNTDINLSGDEIIRLKALEGVIESGKKAFIEVGMALTEIRDNRLYRKSFDTFEAYCQERWSFSRNFANMQINAAEIASEMLTTVNIPNEKTAREFVSVPKEQRQEVAEEAKKIAAEKGRDTINSRDVKEAKEAVFNPAQRPVTEEPEATVAGGMETTGVNDSADFWMSQDHREQEEVPPFVDDLPLSITEDESKMPIVIESRFNHRAQGTGENEWYTPSEYIVAARRVMGAIELDPASSAIANQAVKAEVYYTIKDNGLDKDWFGRVWMNPPYSQPHIFDFAKKLCDEYADGAGSVKEAIALTHNYTDTAWFHLMGRSAKAICFTRGRVKFYSPEGKFAAPTQGQALFYFGDNTERFIKTFSDFGLVVHCNELQ